MLAKSKRLLAPILALMIVIGTIAVPAAAEAATKPTATYYGSTKRYVKRGKTYTFQFYLNSRSYSKKSYGLHNGYRASFDCDMYEKSSGRYVDYTNYLRFSGSAYKNVKWYFNKSVYSRNTWYKLRYRTQYRKSVYSDKWYTAKAKWIQVKVK